MSELSVLLERLEHLKSVSEMKDSPYEVFEAAEGAMRASSREVAEAVSEYTKKVSESATFILLDGPGSKEVAKAAADAGVFVVGYHDLADHLYQTVVNAGGGKAWDNNTYSMINNLLKKELKAAGVSSITPLKSSRIQDVKEAIRDSIDDTYGGWAQYYWIQHKLGRHSLEHRFAGKSTPAIILDTLGTNVRERFPKAKRVSVTLEQNSSSLTIDDIFEMLKEIKGL